MRHLPWCRLGTGFVIVSLLLLLGRYTFSPSVQVAPKRDRGDGTAVAPSPHADVPRAGAGGEIVRDYWRPAAEGAVANADAAELSADGPDRDGGDGAQKDRGAQQQRQWQLPEEAKDGSEPGHAELQAAAVPPQPKGRATAAELAAGGGQVKAVGVPPQQPVADGEAKSEGGKPTAAVAAAGAVAPAFGPAAAVPRLPEDSRANPFEGLPLNVAVGVKGAAAAGKPTLVKEAAEAAQQQHQPSPPGKEATFEQLKQYFEPDMASKKFDASVLIVTPLRNARGHLQHYVDLLRSLSYPHELISVALGEDSSVDGTYELATSLAKDKLADFRRVSVFHLDHVLHQGTDWSSVHAEGHQLERRGHMARARNELLSRALRDEEYVLWVDSDVGTWPADIVQHLLDARVDIVAPACMYRSAEGHVDVYDRNTWRETPESLTRQRQVGDDYLMLEGYGGQPRLYLPDLRGERRRVVKVDGVGGCVLLVRSVIHRRGLVFPSFVFRHHVETEGLAKMAAAMGHQCYGMPFLEVYHL